MKTLPIYLVRSEVQTACLQLTLLAADPDRVEELTLPDGSSEAEMETWIEAIMDARFASAAAMMESIADDNGQLKRKTGSACRRYMNKLTFPSLPISWHCGSSGYSLLQQSASLTRYFVLLPPVLRAQRDSV
jgi:hypothetical protein